jgi:hypothetical protein
MPAVTDDRWPTEWARPEPPPDLTPDPGLIQDIEAGGRRRVPNLEPNPLTHKWSDGPPSFGWWHRHRWGAWGETFSGRSSGVVAVIEGFTSGPWWQERVCVECGRAQRARVEVEADR